MAIVNKPDMNYGTWAENGNIEIPSSEKVEEGWVIEKPLNEHMNWVQNRQDKMLQYLNQRGMAEWDFRTEYPKDAYVVRSGSMYKALVQNVDKDPTSNTNIWRKPFAESGVADGAGGEIEKIKNQDGYLSHYVRKSAPVMDAPCVGVSYYNKTQIAAFTFMKDTQAPAIIYNGNIVGTFGVPTNPKEVVTRDMLGASLQGYKVGDIYITTANGDPKERLGYGTWERFAQGEVLVGFSTSVSNSIPQWVKTAGAKFGTFTHVLTTEEMPSKAFKTRTAGRHGSREHGGGGTGYASGGTGAFVNIPSLETGWKDAPHNNVQPSVVVYMWKRTA